MQRERSPDGSVAVDAVAVHPDATQHASVLGTPEPGRIETGLEVLDAGEGMMMVESLFHARTIPIRERSAVRFPQAPLGARLSNQRNCAGSAGSAAENLSFRRNCAEMTAPADTGPPHTEDTYLADR